VSTGVAPKAALPIGFFALLGLGTLPRKARRPSAPARRAWAGV